MATGAVNLPVKAVYEFPNLGIRQTTYADGSFQLELIKKPLQKEGNNMSDHARMRVTLDLPVDPASASMRVIKAIAGEQRDYTEVVLVKDREVSLTDHVEVINVHVHTSQPGQACGECVEELAMDGRS